MHHHDIIVTNAMEYRLDGLENLNVAIETLRLVDAHFRAVSSLEKIFLEVYDDGPSDYVRSKMKSYGWTLHVNIMDTEEENWDQRFSDANYDGFNDDYDDNGDSYDDYDIDNDSDFWRRAAD